MDLANFWNGPSEYQIERSLRFNSADSAYLNRTPASAGNQKTWTWSGWVKRSGLGATQVLFIGRVDSDNKTRIDLSSTETLRVYDITGGGTERIRVYSTQVFRDVSAWYHIVVAVDTTQATASNRVKVYVNGSQITAFGTADYPSQNTDTYVNATNVHEIGREVSSLYLNAYLTEINFIDGQALTPSSFGETDLITGVWKPKKYAGTYGTNGFYLNFKDNSSTSALGTDYSGNGNNWTPNNFSVTAGAGNDSMIDVPTNYDDAGNGRGNYCVLTPLGNGSSAAATSGLSNGNLQVSGTITGGFSGSMGIPVGKWYWEVTLETVTALFTGVCNDSRNVAADPGVTISNEFGFYFNPTINYMDGSGNPWSTGSVTNGDIIGVAVDASNLASVKLWLSKNNTWYSSGGGTSGNPAGGTNPIQTITDGKTLYPYCSIRGAAGSSTMHTNFGQRAFAYTPPSGFLALNTQNLPEPTIKKPSSYFDTVLYTGTAATLNITGLGFSPDLVWIKNRTSINNNRLYDTLRGTTKELYSNDIDPETTNSNTLTAFNSNGFTLGSNSGPNNSGSSYVAWCWDESATPGFDIVTYSGNGASPRSINHSLGVSPSFVVVKNRTTAGYEWPCYHTSLGTGKVIWLHLTNEADLITNRAYGGIDSVSSTTFTVKSGGTNGANVNANGDNYVAYLWSEVAGFSKFGSYTGNGSSDGPFVFCGFRPRWIMIKSSSVGGGGYNWYIYDTSRSSYNPAIQFLYADLTDQEASSANAAFDFTSNGFKVRSIFGAHNGSGNTYIFAAYAESPFKYSLAR